MNPDLSRILDEIERDMTGEVAARFTGLAADYFAAAAQAERPVSTRLTPEELLRRFENDFPEEPTNVEEITRRLAVDVVAESNWLYHPRYMGHQVTAVLPAAAWTDALISALNQSVAVQEMSPAITMIEHCIIQWLGGLAGFGASCGGTFTSGGTEANFTALLAARAHAMPDAWQKGVAGKMPVVLCGEHAHYAITRAVAQLGLGLDRALIVDSPQLRMDPAALKTKLTELRTAGTPVMAVVATAGSTPTGSFDDLNTIADVCDAFDVWLHVDGAHGASALLSPNRKHLMRGVERARSLAWDPHKLMLMPLSVGVVLVRDQRDLDAAFSQSAPYLFHGALDEKSWDQGGRSFQCSRRGEALKLWVALQRYGTRAFGLLYDYFSDLAAELHAIVSEHLRFEAVHEPECNILCFRYAGSDALNLRLRTEYNTRGTGWITTTMLQGQRVLRTTLMNPRIQSRHLHQLITELDEIASRLSQEEHA
ncbi:MAG TPA: pyridoxal-dependent decarboxylase [Lysobacter sp.]|jgi:L-2,4-diaminobutyrate decarboxylase|nr:pyridoxal-dependent decarboxylase [Lysobacter sp.]